MAPPRPANSVDDPGNINRFLSLIGAGPRGEKQEILSAAAQRQPAKTPKATVEEGFGFDPTANVFSPMATATPVVGVRAPPATPLTREIITVKSLPLEEIRGTGSNVAGSEVKDYLTKAESPLRPKQVTQSNLAGTPTRAPLTPKNQNGNIAEDDGRGSRPWTSTQKALLARQMEMNKNGKHYMDFVVDRFRREHEVGVIEGTGSTSVGISVARVPQAEVDEPGSTNLTPFPTFDESAVTDALGGVKLSDENSFAQAPAEESNTDGLPSETESLPSISTESKKDSSPQQPKEEPATYLSGFNQIINEPSKATQSPTIVVTQSTDTEGSKADNESDEDRHHRSHFKSWGTPTARSKPKAQVRTVVLSGLPGNADFTLVQALIHGGSIETMKISPLNVEAGKTTARVTFTTPEAFTQYYEKYPNGFDFRIPGKKCSVLVGKQEQVDVMSSVVQGYLECGATRVVKVTGAEDDWGIVALHKLASGGTHSRQLESINDRYRNATRTIFFRFSNISDAVKFRGHLMRDLD